MSLRVLVNKQVLLDTNNFPQDHYDLEFSASLPLTVTFETAGKLPEDTIVDHNGNILEDKFVAIEQMCVDGIWIKKWILESKLFENSTSTVRTNYFGQNGTAQFRISHTDIMRFWLDTVTVDD